MKTEAEINAEKHSKSRVDIVPPVLMIAAGRALGLGASKHGVPPGYDGFGTWRIAGTEQAEPLTHYACLMRHLLKWRGGETIDPETGDAKVEHLEAAAAQLAILLDLLQNPPVFVLPEPTKPVDEWALPPAWTWREAVMSCTKKWKAAFEDQEIWIHTDGSTHGYIAPRYPEIVDLVKRRNGVTT